MRDPERFQAGQVFHLDGIDFRIREGSKFEGDLVLEWRTERGWRPVTCDPWFLFVDFIAWNEDNRFPHPKQGGEKLLAAMKKARIEGWRRAIAHLHTERARRAERIEYGETG